MKVRRILGLATCGLLTIGCGRTGLVFDEDPTGNFGADGDEFPGFDDEELPPDDRPLPDPPLPESCSNGIAEPGELCFRPEITFWSRIDPCALDIGDIDGDGHLDVITPNSDFEHAESTLNLTSVLYGNGMGSLSEPVPYESGDDIPVGVRLGDIDTDGSLDAVVVNSDAGSLSVMMNFGERVLFDEGRVTAGLSPVIADLGDLNGDGALDVVIAASDELRFAFGRGDGTFLPSTSVPRVGQLWEARLLDINSDGAVDMLASNTTLGLVHVWFGDGQGGLTEASSLETPGMPLGISDADVDGNGTVDLLVAQSLGMTVFLGDGQGGFERTTNTPAGLDPRDIAVADFDNDGRLDAAILNSSSEDITLVVGRGNGEFEYGATYSVGTLPSGIEAGDFNSDGVPDMAVSNQLSNNIGLVLSDP